MGSIVIAGVKGGEAAVTEGASGLSERSKVSAAKPDAWGGAGGDRLFRAYGSHSLYLRQYQTADIRWVHKSAADPNVERTPHRLTIVIASNPIESAFATDPSAPRARRRPISSVACERWFTSAEWARQRTTAARGESRLCQLHLERREGRAFVATRASSVCFLRAQPA